MFQSVRSASSCINGEVGQRLLSHLPNIQNFCVPIGRLPENSVIIFVGIRTVGSLRTCPELFHILNFNARSWNFLQSYSLHFIIHTPLSPLTVQIFALRCFFERSSEGLLFFWEREREKKESFNFHTNTSDHTRQRLDNRTLTNLHVIRLLIPSTRYYGHIRN